jgi:long-subunit fatty acid transport protein
MTRVVGGRALALVAASLATAAATPASASNGLDSPDAGVLQMSRGGAWVARADNPLNAYFNPAAMTFYPSGVHLGAQLLFRSHCFDRVDQNGQRPTPGNLVNAPAPEEVCADISPIPNPQLAATFRLHKQWAIGIAFVAPHAAGTVEWPTFVEYANNAGFVAPRPAPTRYMLLDSSTIAAFPTLSVGFRPIEELAIGAGFTWGFALYEFSNMAEAVSAARCDDLTAPCPSGGNLQPDNYAFDIRANIKGIDGFVPGFVIGALYAPTDFLDIGAWYRFSDKIRSSFDLETLAPFYDNTGSEQNPDAQTTNVADAGNFAIAVPMEARLGLRYHHARAGGEGQEWLTKHGGWARDSFSEDLFDVELDLTWAHNSQVDRIEITMNEQYQVNGTGTGRVPIDASQLRNWNDVFGVRVGGEYVPIADLIAVRAGGFFESRGVDPAFVSTDFHLGERAGVALGAGVRIGPVDVNLGYQHTFFFSLDNGGQGEIRALSGDGSNELDPPSRSRQPVNGGKATSSLDEFGLGGTFHW